MKILVIEDDKATATYLTKGLREAGHAVDAVDHGHDGLRQATICHYDLLIVDRMLPGHDGLTLLQALRDLGRDCPAIILSALGGVDDRVKGLRAGADDYLTKPFAFSELLARIDALRRRFDSSRATAMTTRVLGDLELDLLARTAKRGGRGIELLPKEFALLDYLMRHAGQIVTRTMLLEHVWGYHFDPQTNVIDVHIARLRHKLDQAGAAPLIHTVRGAGYTMRTEMP
jgi:two-component system, OmpR family, response regulator